MADETKVSSPADHYFEPVGESATAENISHVLNDLTDIVAGGEPQEKNDTVKWNGEKFILGKGGQDTPPIPAKENEALVGDGNEWAAGVKWFYSDEVEPYFNEMYRNRYATAKMLYTELEEEGVHPLIIGSTPKEDYGERGDKSEKYLGLGSTYMLLADKATIRFEDNANFNLNGKTDIDIGNRTAVPERTFYKNKVIAGPTAYIHGNTYVIMDGGENQGLNSFVSHGNVFIDISDAATGFRPNKRRRKGIFADGTSFTPGRPWAVEGETPPTGPWIHIHGDPAIVVDGAPEVKLDDYAQVYFTGDCLFKVQGEADGIGYSRGKAEFVMEPGTHVKFAQLESQSGQPVFVLDDQQLFFGTKAGSSFSIQSDLGGLINGTFGDWPSYIIFPGFSDSINITGSGIETMQNVTLTTLSRSSFADSAIRKCVNYGPSALIQGNALMQIGGRGYTCMQITPDDGAIFNLSVTPDKGTITDIKFGCGGSSKFFADITPKSGTETYIKFGGDSGSRFHAVIDPAGGSNTYLKFSPGGGSKFSAIIDPPPSATTDIKFAPKSLNTIYYTPNAPSHIRFQPAGPYHALINTQNGFIQQEGCMHHEMHDYSTFIMRGITDEPWLADKQADMLKDQRHMSLDWSRPYHHRMAGTNKNGPVFQMYENSNFIMRGVWSLTPDTYVIATDTEGYTEEKTQANIDLFMSAESGDYQRLLNKYPECDVVEIKSVSFLRTRTSGLKYEISVEAILKKKGWYEYVPSGKDHPVIEVTDTSELRLHKGASIIADESGIVFKCGTESIHFTISELRDLKGLLHTNSGTETESTDDSNE